MLSQRWQPTRLPRPWDSPGKNTGVGCHFLLQCMKVKSERKSLRLSTWKLHSHVRLLATPWTAVYQAPLSMGFSRQEYGSGVPLPSHILLLTQVITYLSLSTNSNLSIDFINSAFMEQTIILWEVLFWRYRSEEVSGPATHFCCVKATLCQ